MMAFAQSSAKQRSLSFQLLGRTHVSQNPTGICLRVTLQPEKCYS